VCVVHCQHVQHIQNLRTTAGDDGLMSGSKSFIRSVSR